jgi:Flp pilus assembly protein TadG
MLKMYAQRGQTVPVWAFGTLTLLTLLAFAVNYGNAVYWQIRAQNAADAVAQGLVSIQATRLNAMLADLHAATVEEYRLRYLARDIAIVSTPQAGGDYAAETGNCTSSTVPSCATMYADLVAQFIAASNRYTSDVQMMESLSAPLANDVGDIDGQLSTLTGTCSGPSGVDCGFDYQTLGNAQTRTAALEDVYSDCCGLTVGGGSTGPGEINSSLLPLEVEVVACAKVPPLFPSALSWIAAPTFTAVGRAAATNVMATQEFMELGGVVNPVTGKPFQPAEFPENNGSPADSSNDDPYLRIDYGGNIDKPYGNSGNPQVVTNQKLGAYAGVIANQSVDIYTGWWTSVAIPPYSGSVSQSSLSCKS